MRPRPAVAALPALVPSAVAALAVAALTLGATSRAPAAPTPVPGQPPAPRLVVVLTVDQLRADYLDRFAPQLQGGLARLARGGARFTDAAQDHAITETAPGHATILSGRHPRSTGVVANLLGVEDPAAPLVGVDSGTLPGASPRRFRGSTLVDWMARRDPRSRALSVSAKDRGAILPLGRGRQLALWYAPSGRFTTSRWYADTLPAWVERVDALGLARRWAGRAWTPLLPDSAYREPDGKALVGEGFPHAIPADPALAAAVVRATPFIDEMTLAVALEGVRAMELGAGPATDLLAVSLSATDAVGHRFGPDSREMHDQVLRLDRALGAFLDTLFALRDSTRVIVALTADHGVQSMPEAVAARGTGGRPPPRRVTLDSAAMALTRWLERRGGSAESYAFESGALFVDRSGLARARVRERDFVDEAARAARATPGVLRVDRVADLARADTVRDAIARRWLHMVPPDYPVPLVVTLAPGNVWGSRLAAEHGSPHDDDARVPLVLWGAPFRAGRYAERVSVVDLAPTLARVLGTPPTERVDGRVLEEALAGARDSARE